jgi:outer membrane protein assembly factor BamB
LSSPSKFLSPNKHPNQADELPSYNGQATPDDPVVISCAGGKVMGIDSLTGNTLWTYHCPGGRYRIPTALIEPPSAEEGRARRLVYVGAGKHLYCLRSRTGEVLWTRQISSCMFGYGFMTMATPWSSRLAAEAYTGFNQNPVAQVRDVQRDGEKNSSGG